MRESIYRDLYNRSYKYGSGSTRMNDFSQIDDPYGDDMPMPVDPLARSSEVKPYVPPTRFDESSSRPFGAVLDAPLG